MGDNRLDILLYLYFKYYLKITSMKSVKSLLVFLFLLPGMASSQFGNYKVKYVEPSEDEIYLKKGEKVSFYAYLENFYYLAEPFFLYDEYKQDTLQASVNNIGSELRAEYEVVNDGSIPVGSFKVCFLHGNQRKDLSPIVKKVIILESNNDTINHWKVAGDFSNTYANPNHALFNKVGDVFAIGYLFHYALYEGNPEPKRMNIDPMKSVDSSRYNGECKILDNGWIFTEFIDEHSIDKGLSTHRYLSKDNGQTFEDITGEKYKDMIFGTIAQDPGGNIYATARKMTNKATQYLYKINDFKDDWELIWQFRWEEYDANNVPRIYIDNKNRAWIYGDSLWCYDIASGDVKKITQFFVYKSDVKSTHLRKLYCFDDNVIASSYYPNVYYLMTRDWGKTWDTLNSKFPDIFDFTVDRKGNIILLDKKVKAYISPDFGQSWQLGIFPFYNEKDLGSLYAANDKIYLFTYSPKIYSNAKGLDEPGIELSFFDSNKRYAHPGESYEFRGTVRDANGSPLGGAAIEVRDYLLNTTVSITTDENGNYLYSATTPMDAPAGMHYIRFSLLQPVLNLMKNEPTPEEKYAAVIIGDKPNSVRGNHHEKVKYEILQDGNTLTIRSSSGISQESLEIYDLLGRILVQDVQQYSTDELRARLDNLNGGIYLIRIMDFSSIIFVNQ